MREVMYDLNTFVIVGILLLGLLLAVEIGFRVGRIRVEAHESKRAQVNTIVGSLLGVLALLLGFTFSLALQRYDSRSEAVIHEANAIGTAILRARLLPEEFRVEGGRLLREYLRARVLAGAVSLDRQQERDALLVESARLREALWTFGVGVAAREPHPVTTGLFLQAVNELIDSYGTRDGALNRHVPEVVLFLLFGTFLLAACLVGYSAGVSGHRASFATYVLMVLIVCLVFIIIDLDRPRRGLIEVSQQSLVDLWDSEQRTPAAR